MEGKLTDEQLQDLYTWVDTIPLSRPKRNIARDFSDGVLLAEIVQHYHPKLVDLHNYSAANSLKQKLYNWETLQSKVFSKLKVSLTPDELQAVVNCKPMQIERLLLRLRGKLADYSSRKSTARALGGAGSVGSVDSREEDGSSQFGGYEGISTGRAFLPKEEFGGGNNMRAVLDEKDQTILELRDTISILELKVKKLEQLVQLKDNKILALQQQL